MLEKVGLLGILVGILCLFTSGIMIHIDGTIAIKLLYGFPVVIVFTGIYHGTKLYIE